jgi:hypothetical protein
LSAARHPSPDEFPAKKVAYQAGNLTLIYFDDEMPGIGEDRDSDIKVFWFFSSEKNCLPKAAK